MSAVVRDAQTHANARASAPIIIAGRTGPLNLLEADGDDWTQQTPTYLAGVLPVSEGVGNSNGSVFAFWIGDRDPGSAVVTQAMTDFISDHDVVGIRFIRALPHEVHAGIKAEWEQAKAMSAGAQRRQLYKDVRGPLVEVETMGKDTVRFHNQGGGFLQSMPRPDFDTRFSATDMPKYEPVAIAAEWLPDEVTLPAYTNGQRWNGWAVPYFERDAVFRLMELMPGITYDEERDEFAARDEGIDEDAVFAKESITVGDKTIDVYGIGAGSWCWEVADDSPEPIERPRMRI